VRLPTSVRLPFGYRVLVKLVTDTEMTEHCEDGADGLWDSESRTIYIRKNLPKQRQRYILWHELGHVLWDGQHALLDGKAMKP
jgi:Zn-dependent peptidase ImmA (M78 family)